MKLKWLLRKNQMLYISAVKLHRFNRAHSKRHHSFHFPHQRKNLPGITLWLFKNQLNQSIQMLSELSASTEHAVQYSVDIFSLGEMCSVNSEWHGWLWIRSMEKLTCMLHAWIDTAMASSAVIQWSREIKTVTTNWEMKSRKSCRVKDSLNIASHREENISGVLSSEKFITNRIHLSGTRNCSAKT